MSYKFVGETIRVLTDHAPRPEFVYPMDKFPNRAALEAEIIKSIMQENIRNTLSLAKKEQVENDLKKANVPVTGVSP